MLPAVAELRAQDDSKQRLPPTTKLEMNTARKRREEVLTKHISLFSSLRSHWFSSMKGGRELPHLCESCLSCLLLRPQPAELHHDNQPEAPSADAPVPIDAPWRHLVARRCHPATAGMTLSSYGPFPSFLQFTQSRTPRPASSSRERRLLDTNNNCARCCQRSAPLCGGRISTCKPFPMGFGCAVGYLRSDQIPGPWCSQEEQMKIRYIEAKFGRMVRIKAAVYFVSRGKQTKHPPSVQATIEPNNQTGGDDRFHCSNELSNDSGTRSKGLFESVSGREELNCLTACAVCSRVWLVHEKKLHLVNCSLTSIMLSLEQFGRKFVRPMKDSRFPLADFYHGFLSPSPTNKPNQTKTQNTPNTRHPTHDT